jgi:hypothetical protein
MGKAFGSLRKKLFYTEELGRGTASRIERVTSIRRPYSGRSVGPYTGLFFVYECDLIRRVGDIEEIVLLDETFRPHVRDFIVKTQHTFLGLPFKRYRRGEENA